MTIVIKNSLGYHHGVAAAVEMCSILEFFCKEITCIYNPRDVGNFGYTQVLCFTNIIFVEVKVFGTFVSDRVRPIYTSLIVIIDCDRVGGVWHMEVSGMVEDVFKFCDTLISCYYLSFAGAEGGSILSDGFPTNGPPPVQEMT